MSQTAEQKHTQVAHQERYQLRKQIRLIKSHRSGMHTRKAVITCNECLLVTAPLKPKALVQPVETEVAKNATA